MSHEADPGDTADWSFPQPSVMAGALNPSGQTRAPKQLCADSGNQVPVTGHLLSFRLQLLQPLIPAELRYPSNI